MFSWCYFTSTGIFGPLTQAAVITFQRIFELTPNGIVGPVTWARLREECGGGIATAFADTGGKDVSQESCVGCAGHSTNPVLEILHENGDANELLLPFLLMSKLFRK